MRDMDSTAVIQYTILSEYQCTVCIVGIDIIVLAGFGIADRSDISCSTPTIRSSVLYSYQLLNV